MAFVAMKMGRRSGNCR